MAWAQVNQFVILAKQAQPNADTNRNNSVYPLIQLLRDPTPGRPTAQEVRTAMNALPADRQQKYQNALNFLRNNFPGLAGAAPLPGVTMQQLQGARAGLVAPAQVAAPVQAVVPSLEFRRANQVAWSKFPATGPLYIREGTALEFRLESNSTGLPAAWSGEGGVAQGATPHAVTFNTHSNTSTAIDHKTVTGTYNQTPYAASFVVYKLEQVLTSEDTIGGQHSANEFGVNEEVKLSFRTVPALTAVQLGGLLWEAKVAAGVRTATETDVRKLAGKLSAQTAKDGLADYQAPYVTDNECVGLTVTTKRRDIDLILKIATGPMAQDQVKRTIIVHTPQAHMKIQASRPHAGHIHQGNAPCAGFYGDVFLFPKNVSFKYIRWQESFGTSSGTGAWQKELDKHQPTRTTAGVDMEVSAGQIGSGCKVSQTDKVYTSVGAGYGDPAAVEKEEASKDWRILWQYRPADLPNTFLTFQVMHHKAKLFNTGKMMVSKMCEDCGDGRANECNGRVEKLKTDPNQNWPA